MQHLVAFCLLSLTVLTLYFRLTRTVSPVVVVLLGSHAVLTECLQAFVPGRTCDPNDALANFAGILLSVNIVLRATSECRKRFSDEGYAVTAESTGVSSSHRTDNPELRF
ncbi:MAG: VanZ family protein [Phycisphaerae bacterium]